MNTEQERADLLPCPFCGGADLKLFGEYAPEWWVCCETCKAATQTRTNKSQAIEDWNRRAALQSQPQETIAYVTRNEEGDPAMLFFDLKEARLYCNPDEEPEALVLAGSALQSQKPEPNDLMLSAVIRMPFEMAMDDPVSRMQFYQRAQQALDELEALQSQEREDAVEVMAILDTGEWSLVRSVPCEWLTDEANNEHRWCVQRQLPPFCGKDGVRHWTGPTAISALRAGMKAIDHARRVEGET